MISSAKRILILWYHPLLKNTGGVENVSCLFSLHYKSLGCQIFSITLNSSSKYGDNLDFISGHLDLTDSLDYKHDVLTFVRENNIDIVFNQDLYSDIFSDICIFLKDNLDVKIISFLHSAPDYQIKISKLLIANNRYNGDCVLFLKNAIKKRFLFAFEFKYKKILRSRINRACKYSDRIVLLSEKFQDEFISYTDSFSLYDKFGRSKITIIPNTTQYKLSLSKSQIFQKKHQIITVSRLDEFKRVDLLLKIWGKLKSSYSVNWEFLIVGDGPERVFLEQYVDSNNIKDVRFLGLQNDLVSYYTDSSIFVFASAFEGFGISILEAMQFGVVPIAFNTYSSIVDLIDDQINGFLINDGFIDDFVSHLYELITNENLRIQMSLECLAKYNKFNVENFHSKYEQLLIV